VSERVTGRHPAAFAMVRPEASSGIPCDLALT